MAGMAEPRSVAEAYDRTGRSWQAGPEQVYRRLAEVLVARSPVPLTGLMVLDLGAGTGAASRAIAAAGGRPLAVDVAPAMLKAMGPAGPPAVVADALHLPLHDGSIDAVVAAFSLNHLADPVAGLVEAARVTRAGGPILASSYAEDDSHPVKDAVEAAATELGWTPPAWYRAVRTGAVPQMSTADRVRAVATEAGMLGGVEALRVPFPDLDASALVAWRMGMAQLAPFVAGLPSPDQARLARRAVALLGPDHPMLERSILVLIARRPTVERRDSRSPDAR
jgi:ubiquinone/menaquinone biosynthesis C-methylase UbiE